MRILHVPAIIALVGLLCAVGKTFNSGSSVSNQHEQSLAKPSCGDPRGVWVNQLKSTLTIKTYDPTSGAITGTYVSPSGTTSEEFPLVGWVNEAKAEPGKDDNVQPIAFSVRWNNGKTNYGSIASWTGFCREVGGVPTLSMQWHLVRANSSYVWDHVLTDKDTFTPK